VAPQKPQTSVAAVGALLQSDSGELLSHSDHQEKQRFLKMVSKKNSRQSREFVS